MILTKTNDKEILISKMFIGVYNQNNIGHEIINFYQPDNCNDSFIYNPPHGKGRQVDSVILVGPPERYAYPILAIALNVEMAAPSLANTVQYGGKILKDINFDNDNGVSQIDICNLTYKVPQRNLKKLPECVLEGTKQRHQKKIYIIPATNLKFSKKMQQERIKELKSKNCEVVVLGKENPQHSYTYCKCNQTYNKDLYDLILSAQSFDNFELLKVDLTKNNLNIDPDSILHFFGKEYSEQVFTNMFYNVLKANNHQYLSDFVKLLLTSYNFENGTNYKISSNLKFEIVREKTTKGTSQKGRIDLLIYNEEYIIIIENKINSLLNGKYEEDNIEYSQLDKYKSYAEKLKVNNPNLHNAKILVFLFVPNYSSLKDMKGTLTYKQLYSFFTKLNLKMPNNCYAEFLNGLAIHSLSKEEDINRRFINALRN